MSERKNFDMEFSDDLVEIFLASSYEVSCRITDKRLSVPEMQNIRAWAQEIAERTDIALGNAGEQKTGFTTTDRVNKKISAVGERMLKNAITPTFASAFKIVIDAIVKEFKQ